MDFIAVFQFKTPKVHKDIAEANDVFGRADGPAIQMSSAFVQQVSDATEQFRERKWFGHVLIHAAVKGLDFVFG